MKDIGIVIKFSNPEAIQLAEDLASWLKERGVKAHGDSELSKKAEGILPASREGLADCMDALVVLGGDGTMLYACRLVGSKNIPILGINMGGLGFLTAINVDEVYQSLEKVLKGDFKTEERMMLKVGIQRSGQCITEALVLNDVAIKATKARLLRLETRINNEYVTTYRADGLIVATPTGSTAYSLSASGPILYPTIHSIILVPVCPFNLTNRSVVIPDWMKVEVKLVSDHGKCELTFDGQMDVPLKQDDVVVISRAEETVSLIQSGKDSYFDILRDRLMWEPR